MRITLKQLLHSSFTALPPVIWIAGSCPYLLQKGLAHIRTLCKKEGLERTRLETPSNLPQHLYQESLFHSGRLIEFQLTPAHAFKELEGFIKEILEKPQARTLLCLHSPLLDKKLLQTSLLRLVEQRAWLLPLWPLNPQEALFWIEEKAKTLSLLLTKEALFFLEQHTSGKLYAAIHFLDYLSLLDIKKTITVKMVQKLLAASAHYTVYHLMETVLERDLEKTLRIFFSLKKEGVAFTLLIWATRELLEELLTLNSTHTRRAKLLSKAAAHLTDPQINTFFCRLSDIDYAFKKGNTAFAEQQLLWILLALVGLAEKSNLLYA